jgi:hypothetical protein
MTQGSVVLTICMLPVAAVMVSCLLQGSVVVTSFMKCRGPVVVISCMMKGAAVVTSCIIQGSVVMARCKLQLLLW